jgi:hypothetical protein
MVSKRGAWLGAVGLILLSLAAQPVRADDSAPAADKSNYSLFNPTPTDAMRAFSPERPTRILNPFTVDAGHFQIESDFVNYIHSNNGDFRTQVYQILDPTIKLGLNNWIDFELLLVPYQNSTTRNRHTGEIVDSARGFGDTILKTKLNLLGNDGGSIALALAPWVKAPTAAPGLGNGIAEGGVALPVQFNLPADFTLALQTEVDALKDANDTRRYTNFVNIANLSHPVSFISKDLSASIEFYSSVGTDTYTPAVYTFDVGVDYLILPNVQLDAGANFGLTRESPNLDVYTGITARF